MFGRWENSSFLSLGWGRCKRQLTEGWREPISSVSKFGTLWTIVGAAISSDNYYISKVQIWGDGRAGELTAMFENSEDNRKVFITSLDSLHETYQRTGN
jgi:hypothetical protein